ncbi:MAG TPA: hypothetical protein VL095_02100 [Flavisolibacter sp.]|nr:hypothetical protein [Flavisolibacter sp.]
MKKFLLVFCPVTLITVLTLFAYNSNKGPSGGKEGITELPQAKNDSLLQRGKYLIGKMNCSDQDLEAIAVHLNNR